MPGSDWEETGVTYLQGSMGLWGGTSSETGSESRAWEGFLYQITPVLKGEQELVAVLVPGAAVTNYHTPAESNTNVLFYRCGGWKSAINVGRPPSLQRL